MNTFNVLIDPSYIRDAQLAETENIKDLFDYDPYDDENADNWRDMEPNHLVGTCRAEDAHDAINKMTEKYRYDKRILYAEKQNKVKLYNVTVKAVITSYNKTTKQIGPLNSMIQEMHGLVLAVDETEAISETKKRLTYIAHNNGRHIEIENIIAKLEETYIHESYQRFVISTPPGIPEA